jgi:CheY-like chemotaxis protein
VTGGPLVLIVEDDADIRDAVQDALTRRGYRVEGLGDGRAALDYLQRTAERPCLILLDLTMPRMSGGELIAELDRDPALAAIPVVVLSAMPRLEAHPQAARWAGILAKPVKLETLIAAVARFCPSP